MKILIGNTGLVGTTLCESINFDLKFNSSNISEFYHKDINNSELYLSCLPATKWIVNQNPIRDFENMMNILNIIKTKRYSKIILISTIDVYGNSPLNSNEDYIPQLNNFSYGNNRYLFELFIKEMVKTDDLKIFRLPALFNLHIKKNIIYDLIHNNNVEQINSNSSYQWYNLNNLHNDIEKYSNHYPDETVFNLFTEPIDSVDIIKMFPNYIEKVLYSKNKIIYDFTTKFNKNGYISSKEDILIEIKKFINEVSVK
jgi:nucleoside-diphosphate-sugar epimerase